MLFLVGPLAFAFCALLPILVELNVFTYSLFVFAILATTFAILQFWTILDIIVEAKKILDVDTRDEQRRIPELLAQIADGVKKGDSYFLKDVYSSFFGVNLKEDITEVSLLVDNKVQIPISFRNLESRMAKDVEVGFVFPMEFLVEKTGSYAIYAADEQQVVRYSADKVHGITHLILSPLTLTPLKKGQFDIRTFLKGENIEAKYKTLRIAVQ